MCISRLPKRSTGGKDPSTGRQSISRVCQNIKRERGEIPVRPAYSSRFRIERSSAVMHPKRDASGGQNLAALCTAAGQNLTAIGSSHSLPETVNLGTVTIAGLVGTLHGIHLLKIH